MHGKQRSYSHLLKAIAHKYKGQDVRTIQLGDMGLGFVEVPYRGPKHMFIRGNHDDPALCKVHGNYLGDYGIIDLEGLKTFYLGGGMSIDWRYRILGKTWWKEEELSYPELAKAIEMFEQEKPDVVLSHEAPYEIPIVGSHHYNDRSRTATALQQMWDIHKPKHWFFGHHHIPFSVEIEGTEFICLPELHYIEMLPQNTGGS